MVYAIIIAETKNRQHRLQEVHCMEEITLYTHYLSPRKGVPPRKLSENTKKIIALVESKSFLESNRYMMSDVYTLHEIVYSARADVRDKLELLNGIMEEFKDIEE